MAKPKNPEKRDDQMERMNKALKAALKMPPRKHKDEKKGHRTDPTKKGKR